MTDQRPKTDQSKEQIGPNVIEPTATATPKPPAVAGPQESKRPDDRGASPRIVDPRVSPTGPTQAKT